MSGLIPIRWYLLPGAYEIHFVGAMGFTSFLATTILCCIENPAALKLRFYWIIGIAAGLFLTALELSQYFQPERDLQFGDAAAQLLGVGSELVIIRLYHQIYGRTIYPVVLNKLLP